MDAEWLALLRAVREVQALGVADAVVLGDAAAVIEQANGRVRCPEAYRWHLNHLAELAAAGRLPPIRYVRRSQNLAGIALARRHPR